MRGGRREAKSSAREGAEGAKASDAVLSDAILAAHAIENRACLCSNDADFSRFPGLNWVNPQR